MGSKARKREAHTLNGAAGQSGEGAPFNRVLFKNAQSCRYPAYIGTCFTGLVRAEWALARFSAVTPPNWGVKTSFIPVPSCAPLGYLTCDGQNIIVANFLRDDAEWLLLHEHDNILAPNTYILLNQYVRRRTVPIVSALYFTKSCPSEPILYRGRSNSFYRDWRLGDLVWCDGIPTGVVLIHRSILEAVWADSEEYQLGDMTLRRVFEQPARTWFDPQANHWENATGTSDLEFCSRLIVGDYFRKAGWPKVAKKPYPFLVDTNIFSYHINEAGQQFPAPEELARWKPGGPGDDHGDPLANNGRRRRRRNAQDRRVQQYGGR